MAIGVTQQGGSWMVRAVILSRDALLAARSQLQPFGCVTWIEYDRFGTHQTTAVSGKRLDEN